jgi:hypothetical protein
LIRWPSLTNHSLIVASFVPSPKSGRLILIILANHLIINYPILTYNLILGFIGGNDNTISLIKEFFLTTYLYLLY